MRPSRIAHVVVLALAAGALVACTPGEDPAPDPTSADPDATAPDATAPTPSALSAQMRTPTAPTVLPDPSDVAVATSRALFETSPVVLLAPPDDPAAQAAAASAAVALGAPLLVVPGPAGEDPAGEDTAGDDAADPDATDAPDDPDATDAPTEDAWRAEVARLDPTLVLAVDVDPATTTGVQVERVAAAELADLLDLDRTPCAEGKELAAVRDLDRDRPTILQATALAPLPPEPRDPAGDAPGSAVEPLDLPDLTPAEPVADTVLLVDGDATTLAAAATARAAGVPVIRTSPDPRATAASVDAVSAVVGPATHVLAAGPGFAAYASPDDLDWRVRTAATGVQLPGGGQLVFRERRLVALYGSPGIPALGLLGEQGLADAVERAQRLARRYQKLTDAEVVPTFEIIATIADRDAGKDGNYSDERPVADLERWVERAEQEGVYVILDLQPGRTDFLTQAKRYETLLEHPNVGLALDPEWRLTADQVHLRQIGSVSVDEVNEVADWLAELTRDHALPQKVFVLHQFTERMIRGREDLDTSHPELATVLHVDGQGSQPAKTGTWNALHRDAPAGVAWGWKNFVHEDDPMLTAEQTYRIDPAPELVTYQ